MSERAEIHRIGTKAFLNSLYTVGQPPYLLVGVSTLLAAGAPKVYSVDEIIQCLYGRIPMAPNIISNAVCRLRQLGVPIKSHGWRGYSYERRP